MDVIALNSLKLERHSGLLPCAMNRCATGFNRNKKFADTRDAPYTLPRLSTHNSCVDAENSVCKSETNKTPHSHSQRASFSGIQHAEDATCAGQALVLLLVAVRARRPGQLQLPLALQATQVSFEPTRLLCQGGTCVVILRSQYSARLHTIMVPHVVLADICR